MKSSTFQYFDMFNHFKYVDVEGKELLNTESNIFLKQIEKESKINKLKWRDYLLFLILIINILLVRELYCRGKSTTYDV